MEYSLDRKVVEERISRLKALIDKETDSAALKTLQLELERNKALMESMK